jgi:hypothetical protein
VKGMAQARIAPIVATAQLRARSKVQLGGIGAAPYCSDRNEGLFKIKSLSGHIPCYRFAKNFIGVAALCLGRREGTERSIGR